MKPNDSSGIARFGETRGYSTEHETGKYPIPIGEKNRVVEGRAESVEELHQAVQMTSSYITGAVESARDGLPF